MRKRNTLQKRLVLDALRDLQSHCTAEEVYARVSSQYANISLATVYRNLNSLSEDGEIRKISVPEAADRYDCNTRQHYHLLCKQCGRFEDAPVSYSEELRQHAQEKSGYQIEGYDIVFVGRCPCCIGMGAEKESNRVSVPPPGGLPI